MGGRALLASWFSMVALMAFCGGQTDVYRQLVTACGLCADALYLEQLKEHVVQMRRDVGDVDGFSEVVG